LKTALVAAIAVVLAACGLSVVGNSDPGGTIETLPDGATVIVTPDGAILPIDAASSSSSSSSSGAVVDGSQPDTGADSGPTKDANGCPLGRGPTMIKVASYCIDSTEVSQAQYQAFLDVVGTKPYPNQAPGCTNVTSHQPGNEGSCHYDPTAHPNMAMVCIDWCAADSFCRWSGKRLCGKLGGGSIPTNGNDYAGSSDEWFTACSNGGSRTWPYGNTKKDTACNTQEANKGEVVDVGSFTSCAGGVTGLFDMVGNAREWENACQNTDAIAFCLRRGGSFALTADNATCDEFNELNRNLHDEETGIRCCADPG
jgi:formylglycine-generating enzyme required for sulfatase activity